MSSSDRDSFFFFFWRCVKIGKMNPTPCVSGAAWSCLAAVLCWNKVLFFRNKKMEAVPGRLSYAAESSSTGGDPSPKSVLMNT